MLQSSQAAGTSFRDRSENKHCDGNDSDETDERLDAVAELAPRSISSCGGATAAKSASASAPAMQPSHSVHDQRRASRAAEAPSAVAAVAVPTTLAFAPLHAYFCPFAAAGAVRGASAPLPSTWFIYEPQSTCFV
jgi:hypothetical protein